jgi:WhiB family redox-sensing transcriptional regulator
MDKDIFFPPRGGDASPAKAVCARCCVREDCLAYALAAREKAGTWGGLTAYERRSLRPARVRTDACGTEAGYRRHLRAGEPACADCRAGAAAYKRERTTTSRRVSYRVAEDWA